MVELKDISTEALLAEIDKRNSKPSADNKQLVVGTICRDADGDIVEVFKVVESEKDLDFLYSVKLRARFNSHRKYKLFYFKTDDFEELNKSLDEDMKAFCEWLANSGSIKYFGL